MPHDSRINSAGSIVRIELNNAPLTFSSSQKFGDWFDTYAQADGGIEGTGDAKG